MTNDQAGATARQTCLAILTAKRAGDLVSMTDLMADAGDGELLAALAMLDESITATAEARGVEVADHLAELGMRLAGGDR